MIVCNGERHPYSTCPIEVWPTRNKGREGHMENMDAWGGREGVFVIERPLEIVRGLYGWEIEGVRAR